MQAVLSPGARADPQVSPPLPAGRDQSMPDGKAEFTARERESRVCPSLKPLLAIYGIHATVRLRASPAMPGGMAAQFVRAEDVTKGTSQQLTCMRLFDGRRNVLEVRFYSCIPGIKQTDPGSSPLSGPPISFWNLLTDLHRVPTRRPEPRISGPAAAFPETLHGKGERRVRVIGRFRLAHIPCRPSWPSCRCTGGLSGNLLPAIRNPPRASHLRRPLRAGTPSTMAAVTSSRFRQAGHLHIPRRHDVLEPAPALPDIPRGVKDAVEPLSPSFAQPGCRSPRRRSPPAENIRPGRGGIVHVIDDDDVAVPHR